MLSTITKIKLYIKCKLPSFFFGETTFSQEGEDLFLERYFAEKQNVFYVDVGAHHPYRFSNTYKLYKKGGSGIAIDPSLECSQNYSRWRPRDKFIRVGVSNSAKVMKYHIFEEPALNTFDPILAKRYVSEFKQKIVNTVEESTRTLADIFTSVNLKSEIDVLSVDVEGLDLEVLESNDWVKFRSTLIIVELLDCKTFDDIQNSTVHSFLTKRNYVLVSKIFNSAIYEDKGCN